MTSLSDLDRLHAEATPTPWSGNRKYIVAMHVPRTIALFPSGGGSYHGTKDPVQATRDRVLVEELVNAYPALRAYLKALEAERDASREVMRHQDRLLWLCEENTGEDIEAVRVTRLATDAARAQMEKQDG